MKGLIVVGLVLLVMFMLMMPLSVYAIGDPEGGVSIGDCNVFTSVLEPDDQLYFVRYDVSYSPEPPEDASDTWQMAIYDTDGVTLIPGATRPLNFYQHNIISMYFTAAQVATLSLTPLSEFKVKIMGNPAVFDPITEDVNMQTVTLAASDWKELSDLVTYLLAQAQILEDDWPLITLLGDTGLLNSTGAYYFLLAIPGLSNFAPEAFEITTTTYTFTPGVFTHDYESDLADKKGERLTEGLENFGGWLGISGNWMSFLLVGVLFAVFAGATFSATKQPIIGLMMGFLVIMCSAWVGLVSLTMIFIIVISVAFFFGITFILGRFA